MIFWLCQGGQAERGPVTMSDMLLISVLLSYQPEEGLMDSVSCEQNSGIV